MDDKNIDVKEKVNFIVAKFTICFIKHIAVVSHDAH